MAECRTVRHSVSPVPEWTKKLMLEPVQYRNNGDWDTGCWNADAGGIGVDADAHTANPVWLINSRKSFSIESIPICNYMFLNRIMTFCSNGFCWAGSSNALQKHIFPNRIIKVQLENYNSFPNYKLFPGLINLLKEKEHYFKILNLYWRKKTINIW